ncbi:MAG: response regulator transcription factor [bacterium]
MRMLFVEDDESFGTGITSYLNQCQYSVSWIKDGLSAWASLQSEHFDMVLLDLELPKLSGEEVLKSMRLKSIETPVIILTGKSCTTDRIRGLDYGADDYIVKPFNIGELHARIRSIQRRTKSRIKPNIVVGNLTLNPETRLVLKSKHKIKLARHEFMLLQLLMENVEHVLPRKQIMRNLYSWRNNINSNAVEVHIHNIRKKCNVSITTVHGVGYKLHRS